MLRLDAHVHAPEACDFFVPADYGAVVCSVGEDEFARVKKLYSPSRFMCAFGVHPWFLNTRSLDWAENVRRFCSQTPESMVGEIGIDGVRIGIAPIKEQIEAFNVQLDIAAELGKTAIVHCVGAWGTMMDIIRSRDKNPTMHFHAFSGSAEIALELMKHGAFFSVSAKQLSSPSKRLLDVFRVVPAESIFPESDKSLGAESVSAFAEASTAFDIAILHREN